MTYQGAALDVQTLVRRFAVECSCGRRFTPLTSLAAVQRGIQKVEGGPDLRLFDCPSCKSTLSVEISPLVPGVK